MKNNKNGKYALFVTFAFLYSGTVIESPYYRGGNPVAENVISSAVIVVYSLLVFRYFKKHTNIADTFAAKIASVNVCIFGSVSAGYTALKYIDGFGSFADYYSSPFVTYSALAGVIICGVYAAYKGRICVSGFAKMIYMILVVWTLAGFLSFAHTKTFVPMDSPFKRIYGIIFSEAFKDTVIPCADITVIAVMLTDNRTLEGRKSSCRWALRGVWMYIVLGTVNLLKNLFLFGEKLASDISNPDLAAIRLIPMFELPEVSVLVNTLAAVLRISVYCCVLMFVLKDAFGNKYSSVKTFTAVFLSLIGVCIVLNILNSYVLTELVSVVAGVGFALSLLFFFSKCEKTK